MKVTVLLTALIVLFTSLCIFYYCNRKRFKEKAVKKLLIVFMFLESLLVFLTIFYAMKLDTFSFLCEGVYSIILMLQVFAIQRTLILSKNLKSINNVFLI